MIYYGCDSATAAAAVLAHAAGAKGRDVLVFFFFAKSQSIFSSNHPSDGVVFILYWHVIYYPRPNSNYA